MFNTPLFAVLLTIGMFLGADLISKRLKMSFLNPLMVSIVLIIGILHFLEIPLEAYQAGTDWMSLLIKPATVAMAIPLYNYHEVLMRNIRSVGMGILAGTLVALGSLGFLGVAFDLTRDLRASIMSKSITTPIGIEVTQQIGGIVPVAIAAIIFTGIVGAALGPSVLKLLGISDKTAQGIALGASAHVIGTAKAIEMDEEVGAMSAIAIPLTGILTVILTPIVFPLF